MVKLAQRRRLSEFLLVTIETRKITAKEFAADAGFTPSQVSRWLTRKTYPSNAQMRKLCDYLHLDTRMFSCAGDNLSYLSLDYLHTQYMCEAQSDLLRSHLFTTAVGLMFNRLQFSSHVTLMSVGGTLPTWAHTKVMSYNPIGWGHVGTTQRTYAVAYHDGLSMDFVVQKKPWQMQGPYGLTDRYFVQELLNPLTDNIIATGVE